MDLKPHLIPNANPICGAINEIQIKYASALAEIERLQREIQRLEEQAK